MPKLHAREELIPAYIPFFHFILFLLFFYYCMRSAAMCITQIRNGIIIIIITHIHVSAKLHAAFHIANCFHFPICLGRFIFLSLSLSFCLCVGFFFIFFTSSSCVRRAMACIQYTYINIRWYSMCTYGTITFSISIILHRWLKNETHSVR